MAYRNICPHFCLARCAVSWCPRDSIRRSAASNSGGVTSRIGRRPAWDQRVGYVVWMFPYIPLVPTPHCATPSTDSQRFGRWESTGSYRVLVDSTGLRSIQPEIQSLPGAGLEPAWGYPRGIFLPLQLSLLHTTARAFVVWTLPLPYRKRRGAPTT